MQISVIEFARNAAGMEGANSREFDENAPYRVIDFMPGQNDEIDKGGTLRLGRYPCVLQEGTVIAECYGMTQISERHRHRYEFANEYRETLQQAGLRLSGLSPDGLLVETVEIPGEEFYIGVQFHPEFKSRPNKPHPLFLGFIGAALRASTMV
jgi:CTP synthase